MMGIWRNPRRRGHELRHKRGVQIIMLDDDGFAPHELPERRRCAQGKVLSLIRRFVLLPAAKNEHYTTTAVCLSYVATRRGRKDSTIIIITFFVNYLLFVRCSRDPARNRSSSSSSSSVISPTTCSHEINSNRRVVGGGEG